MDVVGYLCSLYAYTAMQMFPYKADQNNFELIFSEPEDINKTKYDFFDGIHLFTNIPLQLMHSRRLFSARKYHKQHVPNKELLFRALSITLSDTLKFIKKLYQVIQNSTTPDNLERIINQYYTNIDLSKYYEMDSADFGQNKDHFVSLVNHMTPHSKDARFIKIWFIPK